MPRLSFKGKSAWAVKFTLSIHRNTTFTLCALSVIYSYAVASCFTAASHILRSVTNIVGIQTFLADGGKAAIPQERLYAKG